MANFLNCSFLNRDIMRRWSDAKVHKSPGFDIIYIRTSLAVVSFGELLHVPIILVGASSYIVQNVDSSICSASFIKQDTYIWVISCWITSIWHSSVVSLCRWDDIAQYCVERRLGLIVLTLKPTHPENLRACLWYLGFLNRAYGYAFSVHLVTDGECCCCSTPGGGCHTVMMLDEAIKGCCTWFMWCSTEQTGRLSKKQPLSG